MSCLLIAHIESSNPPNKKKKNPVELMPAGQHPKLSFTGRETPTSELFLQQLHDPYKWGIAKKENEQAFQ